MRRVWIAGVIIAAVLIVGFVLFAPHAREVPVASSTATATVTPVIYLHDVYKKGTHTLTGSLALPTPCTTISEEVSIDASATPEAILVAVDMPLDSDICLQQTATTTFSATIAASADATLEASVNGAPARVVAH